MRSFLPPLLLFVIGLAANAIADPTISPWTLHEKRSKTPAGWMRVRKHEPSASIPLRFALAQPYIEDMESLLYDVSHPDSSNYGKHWSAAQVATKFSPSIESIETVRAWLNQSGVEDHRVKLSPTNGWLEVISTVEEAENLLSAEYHVYEHESGTRHIACDCYHLPEHVIPHVDFVTPTVHFDAKLRKRDQSQKIQLGVPGSTSNNVYVSDESFNLSHGIDDCDKQITPDCLRALYGLFYQPVSGKNNSYGIVEYTPQAYVQSDLDSFARNFSTGLEGISPTLVSIDGGIVQTTMRNTSFNLESNFDFEYGMTLVTKGQKVTLYQVEDMIKGASFNNFLDALDGLYCQYDGGDDSSQDSIYPDKAKGGYKGKDCGTVKPAHVISTSYRYNEADLSAAYAIRQCNEYGKLGLLGVTVLYASGDSGVAGGNNLCLNSSGNQTADGNIFNPGFPSTCPYVTVVGGTQVNPGQSVWDPESAMEQTILSHVTHRELSIISGGGFSNYFSMPDYQKTAVEAFLAANPISYSKDIYNSTGSRAYPDLSANGVKYVIAVDGTYALVYGTSASSPVVGAILTMVNDARIAAGQSTIGFINPCIYSSIFAAGFNDITNGSNPGCGTPGFNTSKGWDPVTGMGTPVFSKLLSLWLTV